MTQKNDSQDYQEFARYEKSREGEHHHRGKSSESLLDKGLILSALAIEPEQVVLDAGCGNGYMSRVFSTMVGERGKVCALDPDETAIATLQEQTVGSNVVPLVGDITTDTGLPQGAFDLIYLSTVVHGFSPEQLKGFEREARRLLAPGGKLAIVEIVKRNTPFGPPLDRRFSPQELRQALGLQPLSTVGVGEFFYLQTFTDGRTA